MTEKNATFGSFADQLLNESYFTRDIIQDSVPLASSLEWELGQQYLRERGNKAFISDASPVPFVVNNDGTLSKNAAEVFFASLLAADQAGTLEDDIYVLELGIGVGLFARFFLDHIQELSHKHHKDYYYRLCYVAADKSERMLTDVLKHGVLANHPGRYRVRPVDAMEPGKALPYDACCAGRPRSRFGRCSSIICSIVCRRQCWSLAAALTRQGLSALGLRRQVGTCCGSFAADFRGAAYSAKFQP